MTPPSMVEKLVYDNPQYLGEKSFVELEAQVMEISHYVNVFMTLLIIKLKLFKQDGGANS